MTSGATADRARAWLAFVVRDPVLDTVLEDVCARLSAAGVTLLRGPPVAPGPPRMLTPAEWAAGPARADVAVFTSRCPCSAAMLADCARLRGIVAPTIGTEFIDLAAVSALGLPVAHGATAENFLAVAEATVMLALMGLYAPDAAADVMRGARSRPRSATEARARMLRGRTVGLIGLGRIGRAVAQRLAGWEVRLLGSDPLIAPEAVPAGVERVELEALLSESDVVCVLASAATGAAPILDARAIARMRPDAFLVNTARGSLIDEDALAEALRDGRLAGAALDVFRVEPLPADSPLRALPNAFLTPHMVAHAREVFDSLAPAAAANALAILAGDPPPMLRNPEVLPRWRQRLAAM